MQETDRKRRLELKLPVFALCLSGDIGGERLAIIIAMPGLAPGELNGDAAISIPKLWFSGIVDWS